MLNLFYQEPDEDRWFPLDRFPRRVVRRIVRGPRRPGGQMLVFLNLCKGLDRLGVPYRTNNYRHCRRNPAELACIVGKPWVLDRQAWENPILFGASVFSHPCDDPDLARRLPVRRILVPGPWIRDMFEPAWPGLVRDWPVGIDTDRWAPPPPSHAPKRTHVLVYDKIRWRRDELTPLLVDPLLRRLEALGIPYRKIQYGFYREEDYQAMLADTLGMVFLCEHETQGLAYQQALSAGVPVLAWDRGGEWQDPSYHPDRVRFGPVSSVPYWDARCGLRYEGPAQLEAQLDAFVAGLREHAYSPRDYILDNLTLEKAASAYLGHVRELGYA